MSLRDDLIRDEGIKYLAYKDSLGNWTIGVGHLLGNTPRMSEITRYEAMILLAGDIVEAEITLSKYFPPFVLANDEVRRRALLNMAFNLGNKLGQFKKFIKAVIARDWYEAGKEMMDSLWAKQVGERAVRLKHMIETGTDPT